MLVRKYPLIRFFSKAYERSFRNMLDLENVPTTTKDGLFRTNNFNEEWLSEWKRYIFNIADDELVLRPFDGSYDFRLLNISMLRILELLISCSTFPPSKEVYEQMFKHHVENMAISCGIQPEKYDSFKYNFDIFIGLFAERRSYILNSGIDDIELNNEATCRFRASKDHLIFGKIVGDALGLHPALGAMLNPTGGIVGSSNSNFILRSLAILPSVRKNGIIHDATGYLRYYHGIGPGYRFLDTGDIRGRLTPINGIFYGWKLPRANFLKSYKWKMIELARKLTCIKNTDVIDEMLKILSLFVIVLCTLTVFSQFL